MKTNRQISGNASHTRTKAMRGPIGATRTNWPKPAKAPTGSDTANRGRTRATKTEAQTRFAGFTLVKRMNCKEDQLTTPGWF